MHNHQANQLLAGCRQILDGLATHLELTRTGFGPTTLSPQEIVQTLRGLYIALAYLQNAVQAMNTGQHINVVTR